jgi:hypothetical protein
MWFSSHDLCEVTANAFSFRRQYTLISKIPFKSTSGTTTSFPGKYYLLWRKDPKSSRFLIDDDDVDNYTVYLINIWYLYFKL